MTSKNQTQRIVFFGSAEFSLPALKALYQEKNLEIVLTITAQAAPKGRGRKLTETAVAKTAKEFKIPVLETNSVQKEEIIEKITALKPDLLVVAAYGGFLPKSLLNLAKYAPLNIHPSLLPKHRGPAPVNWALIKGDKEIGVSIIYLVEEMDAGPILKQSTVPFKVGQSAGEIESYLAVKGAELLLEALIEIQENRLIITKQNSALATVNPLLKKHDGYINWENKSEDIIALINGTDPWPGSQALLEDGKTVKFFKASSAIGKGAPGEILGLAENEKLIIASQNGALAVSYLQVAGKNKISGAEFLRGYQITKFNTKVIDK